MHRIYYGWWILASSIVIVYLFGTVLFGFPAFYPSFITSFGWSRSQLLFGNTVLQWVFGVSGLVWGVIAEKRGTRLVLSIGSGFVAAACLLFGRMQVLWQLYAICFMLGAGLSAMGYLTNQMLQARWFAHRRGLAIGLVNSAGGLSGSAAPVLLTFLIGRFGSRNAMGIMDAFLWSIPFLLIFFVIRERPEDIGLDRRDARAESKFSAESVNFREVALSPVLWIVVGSVFFAAGTVGTTLHLLILHLRDSGFSQQAAAAILSLEFAFSFVGRLGFGMLADRFSAQKAGIVSVALLATSSLLLFAVRVPGMLVGFALFQGLGHGALVSFFPLVLAEIFGTEKHLGRLLAIGHLAYSGGLGTMPIISAYAFDRTGSFTIGFAVNSIMTWLAVFALLGLRPIGGADAVGAVYDRPYSLDPRKDGRS
jgi:MFS family permease